MWQILFQYWNILVVQDKKISHKNMEKLSFFLKKLSIYSKRWRFQARTTLRCSLLSSSMRKCLCLRMFVIYSTPDSSNLWNRKIISDFLISNSSSRFKNLLIKPIFELFSNTDTWSSYSPKFATYKNIFLKVVFWEVSIQLPKMFNLPIV